MWFPAIFLHGIKEVLKKRNVTVLAFHSASFSENDKLLNRYFALEIVLNTLIYFFSPSVYIHLEIFLTVLRLFNAKNLYWHRGLQERITEALKDKLAEHLGTRHNSNIFEHLKMLISCKTQKYPSHLSEWAKNKCKKITEFCLNKK